MFPFIEENESFVTGDGTVYYLHYEDVPKYILRYLRLVRYPLTKQMLAVIIQTRSQ
jgi:hypothetical protein